MALSTKNLCHRLRALGVPRLQTQQMLSDIARWSSSSGEEWTVERLKTLKQAYIMKIAGLPFKSRLFKTNKKGNPRGVWSWVFNRPNQEQALNILMCYSCFTSQLITQKQRTKFFGSMESASSVGMGSRLKPTKIVSLKGIPSPDLITDYYHRNTRCPIYYGSQSCSEIVDQIINFGQSTLGQSVLTDPALKDIVRKSLPFGEDILQFTDEFKWVWYNVAQATSVQTAIELRKCVGKISAIQEPGFKLRAVATPNIVWQVLLSPLNQILQAGLRAFPGDCTFNQEKGYLLVQQWLREGMTLHSVDLSDATNMFPRNLQIKLIAESFRFERDEDTVHFRYLTHLFKEVSEAPWFFKEQRRFTFHTFTRGQPLGLAPSFASFAFAHNTLVRGIAINVLRDRELADRSYVILGDDIVINNSEVARIYKETMRNLGCTISESKTITSNVIAEFAGKVITKEAILTTYKWKPIIGSNFLDMARNMGPRSLGLLNRSQRKVVKQLSSIPEFIKPGLGWNPKGIPLTERMNNPLAVTLESFTCDNVTETLRPVAPDLDKLYSQFVEAGLNASVFIAPAAKGDQPFGNWSHPSIRVYNYLKSKAIVDDLELTKVNNPPLFESVKSHLFRKLNDVPLGDPRDRDSLRLLIKALSHDNSEKQAYLYALGLMRTSPKQPKNPVHTISREPTQRRIRRHPKR